MTTKTNFYFVDYLKSVAILLILVNHFFGSFWQYHKQVAEEIFSNPIVILPITSPLVFLYKFNINLGYIGVGLFFLITGFLIPKSVEVNGSKKFLIKRLIRLYPTYLIVFLIVYLFLHLNAAYNQVVFPFNGFKFIANLLLVQDWFNLTFYDNGIWFLLIIIKFYLLSIFIFKNEHSMPFKLILTSFILGFVSTLSLLFYLKFCPCNPYEGFLSILIYQLAYIIFILLGSCFYFYNKKIFSIKVFFTLFVFITLIFLALISSNFFPDERIKTIVNYGISLIIFNFFYLIKNSLYNFKLINYISKISYPLYLSHRVPGYILLAFLAKNNVNLKVAYILVFSFCFALSHIIYSTIDRKINRYNIKK